KTLPIGSPVGPLCPLQQLPGCAAGERRLRKGVVGQGESHLAVRRNRQNGAANAQGPRFEASGPCRVELVRPLPVPGRAVHDGLAVRRESRITDMPMTEGELLESCQRHLCELPAGQKGGDRDDCEGQREACPDKTRTPPRSGSRERGNREPSLREMVADRCKLAREVPCRAVPFRRVLGEASFDYPPNGSRGLRVDLGDR